jgi:transposase InsO family protein
MINGGDAGNRNPQNNSFSSQLVPKWPFRDLPSSLIVKVAPHFLAYPHQSRTNFVPIFLSELSVAIADYTVNFYDQERRHSSLKYLTPQEFEALASS